MIVSLHLPKTAGTSFSATLENHYGTRLLKDYTDFPINTPPPRRNRFAVQSCLEIENKDFSSADCIHGHFLPIKYLLMRDKNNATFITWIRNPVDRALSNYYFWRKTYKPENSPPLHRRVIEENWSLERFCLGPELRNLYAQFLYGFPLEYFSFIGLTEFYDEDLLYFSENFLQIHAEPKKINVGNSSGFYQISDILRLEIEAFHADDMILYNRALSMRNERLRGI